MESLATDLGHRGDVERVARERWRTDDIEQTLASRADPSLAYFA